MHLAKFSYSEAAYDAKLLDTKTKLRLVQRNKNSHMREKQVKPSPYIYMDCKSHSKLSGPRAGGPVRVGAMHRFCSSGLSPSEGGRREQSHRRPFLPFCFSFSIILPKKLSKRV